MDKNLVYIYKKLIGMFYRSNYVYSANWCLEQGHLLRHNFS